MKLYRIEDKFGKGMYNADDQSLRVYARNVMYTSHNHPSPCSDAVMGGDDAMSLSQAIMKTGVDEMFYFYGFTSLEMMLRWINLGDVIDSNAFFQCNSTLTERLFASGAVVVEYDMPYENRVFASKCQAVFVKKLATRVRELEPEEWI